MMSHSLKTQEPSVLQPDSKEDGRQAVGSIKLLGDAKRRYANARRRARFWSGNPSLSNFGPRPRNLTTGRMDEKYELAMCDCRSWEDRLKELTGKDVNHYDPKQAFRRRGFGDNGREATRPDAEGILTRANLSYSVKRWIDSERI